MPELEKQEFIKQTFIDRTDLTFLRSEDEQDFHKIDQQFYHWYEYVPFDVAFPELKKLILAENKPTERIGMLSVLIKCARKNPQHIKTLLQFTKDRHVNEPHKFKHQFVNNLLSQISTHELDVETWNILDQLFYSMEVYSESEKNVQLCVQSIVLYKVLHDEPVPEIVERKMEIDKFERNQLILNEEQNDKIFTYLLNSLLTKIRSSNIANKSDFDDNLQHLTNVLNLLKDWKKDISCFPFVLEKIQELVNIKLQNSWEINSDIYDIKKSWRKHMFEESLSLSLCEETCLNALKHKPQLLARHDKEIDALRADDAVSLRRLLARLRVYWPHSLAQQWTQAYLLNLNKPTGQKAVIRGLFALLPQDQIIDLAKKQTPDNFKINWGEIDQTKLIRMPPLTLEGDTLGEKRRHFNKLVARAIADKHYELCNIRADHSDVDNLLKIDIACKTRNVDYIMEVMKSTDMLYAATAIKKSTWLITEQQYAHIINPETDLTFLRSEDEQDFHKIDQQFYHWYEYVPFDVAFPELKKLILAENKPTERIGMLSVLIKCARKNPQHIKTLLQFTKDRHVNEPHKFKHQFVNNLLSQISTHELDVETWNILDQLFYSMEVYSESEKNVQLCLQSIVLYKVLHDEPVPEIVERKMEIDKFERNQLILNEEQNDKIFTYLLNSLLTKIRSSNIANKSDFDDNLQHLTNVLNLLKDWKKDISCFPFVLEKIQELVNIKLQNSWEINSDIYDIKKSWRKHMFEESLSLSLCEETCLNALKHKPQLLARHDKEIDALRADDAVSLRRLLSRLRVYWPHSLAQHWTQAYLLNLNKPTGQKAVIRGLFALLPQDQIIDLAKKHTPDNFKINWGEIDQTNPTYKKSELEYVMAPLDLQGDTLGERHQNYNKLLKTAIDNQQPVADFTLDDNDVEKLLKIDLACNNKNVDYIIDVFKRGDMLCLSRALAQSIWLITDPQYAHIINPDYLRTQLLPNMSTKAFIKLNKHIRHNIQDETRAEQFYLQEKKITDAYKWLPRCSVAFIEANIAKHVTHCKLRTFKRLCEKSPNIFEIFIKQVQYYDKTRYAQAVTFLLKADVEKYLDILEKESNCNSYNLPKFNDKATNIIMRKCPKRIMDKFDRNTKVIVESIIIYNLLHDLSVPADIQEQFSFGTLKSYGRKLNEEQKEKIFRYLYEFLLNKFKPITNEESSLTDSIGNIDCILRLLRDWNKQLTDYPFVIDKIKECVKVKRENAWKVSLLPIYNFNKSWRKHMFEESVAMSPCEEVCLNALKHEPQLLTRHQQVVDTLRANDAVSLRRLLAKLRIYWPHSLAQQWIDAYFLNLDKTDGHKATVRGICSALPQKLLLEFIEKYKPAQAKIDWNGIDDRVLSIQRFIAKNMHIARPQPSPDTILLYAKGDYLQFALPSLLAIFYNLNIVESQEHIPKLLDAPVSVQKHGIRLAYRKLEHETVKKIFFDCWKASKNASIRAIIFKFTFELLCREKDPVKAVSLWELIELFIDNLTFEEDKKIYDLMAHIEQIPLNVRAKYLMKSYKFMKSLAEKVKEDDRAHYQVLTAQLAQHSREIMDDMNPDFVTDVIQEFIDKDFFGTENYFGSVYPSGGIISVLSAYLLCSEDENIQKEKYEKVFVPVMQRAFTKWGEKRDGSYVIRDHFQYLLTRLSDDIKEYVAEKKKIIPVKMFIDIQTELDKNLTISENYMLLSKWKLTVAVVKLVGKLNSDGKDWEGIVTEIAPEFGKICLDYLKEDVKLHFPCIYKLFAKVLNAMFLTLITNDKTKVTIYESLLADTEFVQGYLLTILNSCDSYSYDKENYGDLWNKILEHPSVEVQMHYYYRKRDERRY
ncbi:hypothetical protein PYW07_008544 [Mythimna separata]|uniref:Uncharacterized protein n=1 Tax=Mythimna separata TaxID=271217 RepID=A0AAD8DP43_MYTSE|nr:hypothetical protein PYW07_008544 [Mythimna separata]